MVKADWNLFRAKFSDNPQKNFEWLCYLLFCKEVGKFKGIFRFKNQAAVETEPVVFEDQTIGWQAKFYNSALSEHTQELIEMVENAREYYPALNKILIYTNSEWGQNKGKQPQGLKQIEDKANELNLLLEWRAASFFESEFVAREAEEIAKYFFSQQLSEIDILNYCENDTQNKLRAIKYDIPYKDKAIFLEHPTEFQGLQELPNFNIIIAGTGGIGKTALVKVFYEKMRKLVPIYLFRPPEFELPSLTKLFNEFSYEKFFKAHENEVVKILVIDSAEKMFDLQNPEPLQIFLKLAVDKKWHIIFTTRLNRLNELSDFLSDCFGIIAENFVLNPIKKEHLNDLSINYGFELPEDDKLLEFIGIPFNLNTYLESQRTSQGLNLGQFRKLTWNRVIAKSKPSRSEVFVNFVYTRVKSGTFYAYPDGSLTILDEFVNDGILGFESSRGYFIAHDIYEEWALEEHIKREFIAYSDEKSFFDKIGQALPIRRVFRSWLSEQLSNNDQEAIRFIDNIINGKDIPEYWKDEALVSMLLSDHCEHFFEMFANELLYNNRKLLNRIITLLQTACTEMDLSFYEKMGLRNINPFSLNYVFTKPRGNGWPVTIKYIFNKIQQIGANNLGECVSLFHEWARNNDSGETTKYCGLLALSYYKWLTESDVHISNHNGPTKLLETIANTVLEIRHELADLIAQIIENKWIKHNTPYHHLSQFILTQIAAIKIVSTLPNEIIKLAELFWSPRIREKASYHGEHLSLEKQFGLNEYRSDYFPGSAYQTPTFWLLKVAPHETIQFILRLSEKLVSTFAQNSAQTQEISSLVMQLEGNKTVKLFSGIRIFCAYRGTQVVPDLYEAIYSALEKYLLDTAEHQENAQLEETLKYILENSKTVSSVAVVIAIVLAYPEKAFNVAKLLFKTRDLFNLDFQRNHLELSHKQDLIRLRDYGFNDNEKLFWDERIASCDLPQRKIHLENLFLKYQLQSSEHLAKRRRILWEILDQYYAGLKTPEDQASEDKIWRIALARMDARKMEYEIKEDSKQTIINIIPQLSPELKSMSEKSQEDYSERNKYIPLFLWSEARLNHDRYEHYKKYEQDPMLAYREMLEVLDELNKISTSLPKDVFGRMENGFWLYYHTIPVLVSCVLLRDFITLLDDEKKQFCAELVISMAEQTLSPDYLYQVGDGSQYVFHELPELLVGWSQYTLNIKYIFLFHLLEANTASSEITAFVVSAFLKLWNFDSIAASKLYFTVVHYKLQFDNFRKQDQKPKFSSFFENDHSILNDFLAANNITEENIWVDSIQNTDLESIEDSEINTLNILFQLLPNEIRFDEQKILSRKLISILTRLIFSSTESREVEYDMELSFFNKLAYLLLFSSTDDLNIYLGIILDHLKPKRAVHLMFERLLVAEDKLNRYDNFWHIWNAFKKYVFLIARMQHLLVDSEKTIRRYLLDYYWDEKAVKWHSLKNREKYFFKEMCEEIGHLPCTLDAISTLLNGIGVKFLPDGFYWIADMLKKNSLLFNTSPKSNTQFYLNKIIRQYTFKNAEEIRKNKKLYEALLYILEYLVYHGSNQAYLARERII